MAGFGLPGAEKLRHKGVLWGVYLRDSHRGHGHGRSLVAHVIAHARAHVAVLRATVVTANAEATALYRALGFETYGIERDALRVEGRSFDEALIELRFDAPEA
jgi:ribosomal protein S18 acetylase RimI-like enzyme